MKSKDLVKRLLELDPTGETPVVIGNCAVYRIEPMPAYYDGCVMDLVRDPQKTGSYDVIGVKFIERGDKINLESLDMDDVTSLSVETGIEPVLDLSEITGQTRQERYKKYFEDSLDKARHEDLNIRKQMLTRH